jgi:hypothetical protein
MLPEFSLFLLFLALLSGTLEAFFVPSFAYSDGTASNLPSKNNPRTTINRSPTACCMVDSNKNGNEDLSEREMAKRIMYHQHKKARESVRYQIIAAEACESLAKQIEDVS